MRLGLFLGALLLALLIGVSALQAPRPRGFDTPDDRFSTARAMVDVRQIARAPHPVGSAEHARVRRYLTARMTQLGLDPQSQAGPLSPESTRRLRTWGGDPDAAGNMAVNLVGTLPGTDADAPAVMLMAHYDSAWDSPGAADDATGVAAILETVRALKARGPIARPLVVVLTDSEELNLDGARIFFGDHPLRDRIGAVVNLEARGGGGRAMMFETGRGNAETVALFTGAAARADGGATSNSLAVFVYERMPNGTDFTIPKDRGIAGLNFAFIGRASQYHSPSSTPDSLDPGSVQHIGSQALEATDALLAAPALPQAGDNRVFADILGRVFVSHAPATGWLLLVAAAGLLVGAVWRVRRAEGLTGVEVGRGLLAGLWFLSTGLVLTQAVRVLAGPVAARAGSSEAYYTLLRRLPWMEAGATLAVMAVALVLLAGRQAAPGRVVAAVAATGTVLALVLGGFNPVVLGAGVVAVVLSVWDGAWPRSTWGGWLGLIALLLVFALPAQALAPEAAFLFVWVALLAALTAAITALVDPSASRPVALVPAAVVTALGGAWLVSMAHPVFLGIGMDLPVVLALMGLLILALVRPLAPTGHARGLAVAAMACLILGAGVSLTARLAEPMPPPSETGPT